MNEMKEVWKAPRITDHGLITWRSPYILAGQVTVSGGSSLKVAIRTETPALIPLYEQMLSKKFA